MGALHSQLLYNLLTPHRDLAFSLFILLISTTGENCSYCTEKSRSDLHKIGHIVNKTTKHSEREREQALALQKQNLPKKMQLSMFS